MNAECATYLRDNQVLTAEQFDLLDHYESSMDKSVIILGVMLSIEQNEQMEIFKQALILGQQQNLADSLV